MRMYDIIHKKRDGGELSREEIKAFIDGYVRGDIPDYQASALMMAIFFRSMTDAETAALTEAMAQSGDMVDLSCFGTLSVDKHSTGGVGDKTSLIVAPIVASLGGVVTKMSGRGLGHTGGTVDKLESIPGYRTTLSREEFLDIAERVGMAVIGQSGNLTPADKKLYALRDVTATVDSIPLITSSIMSKKLAAGSHTIVLDVKVGSGAFMKTEADAELLAEKMVEIGALSGRNMAALLTDMDTPLGNAVGNSLEIAEAVEVLSGKKKGDLYEVCVALATQMASLCLGINEDEARARVIEAISSGAAFEKMAEWVSAQGGDARFIKDPSLFPKARIEYKLKSEKSGYIFAMDAEKIGLVSVLLGAGRVKKEDEIDHSAGIILNAKVGDFVNAGDTLCTLYTNNPDALAAASEQYRAALTLSDEAPPKKPLIYKVIRKSLDKQ